MRITWEELSLYILWHVGEARPIDQATVLPMQKCMNVMHALHACTGSADKHLKPSSDWLRKSAAGGAGYGAAAAGAGGEGAVPDGYEFGVDPNLDPELAMALRVSMQEERSRQEAAAASSDAAQPAAAEGAHVPAQRLVASNIPLSKNCACFSS